MRRRKVTRAPRGRRSRPRVAPRASRPRMPGYGLPRSRKGLLSWDWAERRLVRSHNYWLITVRPHGRPHAMPGWGIWVDGAFYFSTGSTSRKARNLERNRRCIVCNERADQAVIVEGRAGRVTDKNLLARLARPYHVKYKPWKLDTAMGSIYVIRPRVAFGMYEDRFADAATRWRF